MTRVKAAVAMNIIAILLFRQLFESCEKKSWAAKPMNGARRRRRTKQTKKRKREETDK